MEAVSRIQATLEEVARAAGVSRATASRVFSGNTHVSEAARQAVRRAAEALGYVPNAAARTLAAGRSESVGVVIPAPTSDLFADPTLARLLQGVGEELAARGLQLVLFAPQSTAEVDRLERYLAGGHVDAVLLFGHDASHPLIGRLTSRGIPVVFGGKPCEPDGLSWVHVDNQAAGRVATEHLIDQGRRHIVHLAGPLEHTAARDRLDGFREAMWRAAYSSELVEHAALDRDGGELAMHRVLARTRGIDAVFAATDDMAVGALWALQVAGFHIPDDVAVIGFDDSPIATATQPPLSSVRQPIEEMGREMVRIASGDRETKQVKLGAEVSVRGSTVRPAPVLL